MEGIIELRRHIAALHRSEEPIEDADLDTRIGLRVAGPEPSLGDLLLRYGHHRVERGDMSYDTIRQLFHKLEAPLATPLIDLGSGYGRIGFYGALLAGIRYWGIELVRERVDEARRVQAALGLRGLEFEHGDATTSRWPESSHFCLMNSVLPSVRPAIIARLAECARRRRILIASVSTANPALDRLPWLEEIREPGAERGSALELRVFRSKTFRPSG
jgi:SAM-dependent methyltransferase